MIQKINKDSKLDSKVEEDLKSMSNPEFKEIYGFVFGKIPSKNDSSKSTPLKRDQSPQELKIKSPEMIVTPSYAKMAPPFAEKPQAQINSFPDVKPAQPAQLSLPEVRVPASAKDPIPEPQEDLVRKLLRNFIAVDVYDVEKAAFDTIIARHSTYNTKNIRELDCDR